MGLFGTQWIQDMMDVSCGFGSWQLSMNAGLAHMQATSLINSCFSFSGFGFTPYSSLDSMSYLLNPNFAAWQATNGISSNSTSIFGNFGGMTTGYTGTPNFSPWGNTWTNTTPGSTGGTDSKEILDDPENKQKADDIEAKLKAYSEYLGKSVSSRDKNYSKDIDKKIKKIKDEGESWSEIKNKLEEIYAEIIKRDSGYAKYIANGKIDTADIIQKTGLEADYVTRDKSYLNESYISRLYSEIDSLSNTDGKVQEVESITSDNILEVLSYYNTLHLSNNLIKHFVNRYNNKSFTESSMKSTALGDLQHIKDMLIARANIVKSKVDEDTRKAIDLAIGDVNVQITGLNVKSELIDKFNDLYTLVRLADVKVVEKTISDDCNGLLADETLKMLDLTNKTADDLSRELSKSVSDIKTKAQTITCTSSGSAHNIFEEGRGGVDENHEPTAEQINAQIANTKKELEKSGSGFTQLSNTNYKAPVDSSNLTKDKEYTIYKVRYGNDDHYYIIDDNGNMQKMKKDGDTYTPLNDAPKSLPTLQSDINEAKATARVEFKDDIQSKITINKSTVIDNRKIKYSEWANDENKKAFKKGLDAIIKDDTTFKFDADYGFSKPDWDNAVQSLKNYYITAYETLADGIKDVTDSTPQYISHSSEKTYHDEVNNNDITIDDQTFVYKFKRAESVDSLDKLKEQEKNSSSSASSKTGLYVGCNRNSGKDAFYIFIDTEVLFQKFKSFLPD